jgi:hypothetical protein
MNVFEGSYMNSSYSAHAAHTNEYIYNFLKLPNKWQRFQHPRAFKWGWHHQNTLKSCKYCSNKSPIKQDLCWYKDGYICYED